MAKTGQVKSIDGGGNENWQNAINESLAYQNCKYQLLSSRTASFNPASTSAADWNGAVAGAAWTADVAAHVRLVNQSTGIIYTLTTDTTCTPTGETTLHGASLQVTDSSAFPEYIDTAPTGAASLVLAPIVAPTATSLVAFAPGTRNVIIYTVPLPAEIGTFVLTRCIVRLTNALVGSGSVTFTVGSTSGGREIIKTTTITSATALGIIGGEVVSTLGTDMTTLNAYEAIYNYGQNIYANVTVTGTVTNGQVAIYLYGLFLS